MSCAGFRPSARALCALICRTVAVVVSAALVSGGCSTQRMRPAGTPVSAAKTVAAVFGPEAVTLVEPEAKEVTFTARPRFRWRSVSPVTSSRIDICADARCARILISELTTASEMTPKNDLPTGLLFWRVMPYAEAGVGTATNARAFVVEAWKEYRGQYITVLAPAEIEAAAPELVRTGDNAMIVYARLLSAAPEHATVKVYGTAEAFGDRRRKLVCEYCDIAGFTTADGAAHVLLPSGTGRVLEPGPWLLTEETLLHELAHVVLRAPNRNHASVPFWIREGTAEWLAWRAKSGGTDKIAMPFSWRLNSLRYALHRERLPRVDDLLSIEPNYGSMPGDELSNWYAMSFSFLAYLLADHNSTTSRSFIRLLKREIHDDEFHAEEFQEWRRAAVANVSQSTDRFRSWLASADCDPWLPIAGVPSPSDNGLILDAGPSGIAIAIDASKELTTASVSVVAEPAPSCKARPGSHNSKPIAGIVIGFHDDRHFLLVAISDSGVIELLRRDGAHWTGLGGHSIRAGYLCSPDGLKLKVQVSGREVTVRIGDEVALRETLAEDIRGSWGVFARHGSFRFEDPVVETQ